MGVFLFAASWYLGEELCMTSLGVPEVPTEDRVGVPDHCLTLLSEIVLCSRLYRTDLETGKLQ